MSASVLDSARKTVVATAAMAAVFAGSYAVACELHTGTTTTTTTATTTPTTSTGKIDMVGINLAGAEFGHTTMPGEYGKTYIYPGDASFKRYSDQGIKLVRLPFRWERIQPKLGTALNTAEVDRMIQTLNIAQKYNMKVILDMHNYYRYFNKQIATAEVPISQFANTWRLIAQRVVNHPAVYGYGLMNEPHDTNGYWPQAALAASKAIRGVDKNRWIFVAGDRWSSAYHWPSYNKTLASDPWMRDPKNNLVYEAHLYIDSDGSGQYVNKAETFAANIGVNKAKPFVEWLKANKLRGYIGEHGVPYWSPSAMVATDNLLTYLRQNCVLSTYWAGGPWWGSYAMSTEVNGRPQLPLLKKHNDIKTCSTIGLL